MNFSLASYIVNDWKIPWLQVEFGFCPLCKETGEGKHLETCLFVEATKIVESVKK